MFLLEVSLITDYESVIRIALEFFMLIDHDKHDSQNFCSWKM